MKHLSCHLTLCVLVLAFIYTENVESHQLVAYWGQNAAHHKPGNAWEKSLLHFCQNTKYDIIVLGFMHKFFSSRNKDNFPGLNFASHCGLPVSRQYPELLRCPNIESGVLECQKRGKKVLLSLGGAAGSYGFSNNNQAELLAQRVWNLFLNGTSVIQRPFGRAVLDGIDLDIEQGSHVGYAAFVRKLRQLMKNDRSKKYLITGAPQCPYPDAKMGPDTAVRKGTALSSVAQEFDHLYIQYYNNFCYPGTLYFWPNFNHWKSLSEEAITTHGKGPKIFVGLPADIYAANGRLAGRIYFQSLQKVADLYKNLKTKNVFGGFMLWDAGFDQNNVNSGNTYGDSIALLFQTATTSLPPTTTAAATTTTLPQTTGETTPAATTKKIVGTPEEKTTQSPSSSTKAFVTKETVASTTTKATATKATTTTTPVEIKTTVSSKASTTGTFPPPKEFSCLNKINGLYVDEKKCNRFIMCSHGYVYHMPCPDFLFFNPKLKVCDWPQSVVQLRPECSY